MSYTSFAMDEEDKNLGNFDVVYDKKIRASKGCFSLCATSRYKIQNDIC